MAGIVRFDIMSIQEAGVLLQEYILSFVQNTDLISIFFYHIHIYINA